MTSRKTLNLLKRYESQNVTWIAPDGRWPIVWHHAKGTHVWDADGKRYLDLTAAFGVAAAGHAARRVVTAGCQQMNRLLHAMGDVHPHDGKARLARQLSRITFERWHRQHGARPRHTTGKVIFCNSGFEAVEAALKTALLATGRPGVIAFEGAYHGLGYGALTATHRAHFRRPFVPQLRPFVRFLPFPAPTAGRAPAETDFAERIRKKLSRHDIGAVLVEPIQVRGGVRIPPPWFLQQLRRACDESGALLILDEIYTGFGRTGKWFACEHSDTIPDIVCLGKALTGGFPLSACVGRAAIMDAWPRSHGEAIHTSTFLGHPVGCAMALAQITELSRLNLPRRSAELGDELLRELQALPSPADIHVSVRGCGLLAGVELRSTDGSPAARSCLRIIRAMLELGFVLLPEGEHGNVICFTPPLIISRGELKQCITALAGVLASVGKRR